MLWKYVFTVELHVPAPIHVLVDTHGVLLEGGRAVGVVVEERFGFRHCNTLEKIDVPWCRRPVTVRCLKLSHEDEGLGLVAFVVEPIQSKLGDFVVAVASVLLARAVHFDEVWIVV